MTHVGLVLGDGAQAVLAVSDGDDAVAGVLEDAASARAGRPRHPR